MKARSVTLSVIARHTRGHTGAGHDGMRGGWGLRASSNGISVRYVTITGHSKALRASQFSAFLF